jgi:hypothetical protein
MHLCVCHQNFKVVGHAVNVTHASISVSQL